MCKFNKLIAVNTILIKNYGEQTKQINRKH